MPLKPGWLSPELFEGRRDYGDYFAHPARVQAERRADVRNGQARTLSRRAKPTPYVDVSMRGESAPLV